MTRTVPYLTVQQQSAGWDEIIQNLLSAGFQIEMADLDLDTLECENGLVSKIYLLDEHLLKSFQRTINCLTEENWRLHKYAQAREQYIRLVTHELKSPIAAVENYLKMILQGYIHLADQEEVLERCVIRTCQERQLIDDLLDLSRLEGESIPRESVLLDSVLTEVLQDYQYDFEEKDLNVKIEIGQDIPPISAAPGLLKSVWCNLISNALKYTPDQGKINIGLRCEGEQLIGWVEDTGIGISEADQARLFQEFFRSENARKLTIPGTGLGLVIVKKILMSMGGRILVQSQENQGARFQFFIPLPR